MPDTSAPSPVATLFGRGSAYAAGVVVQLGVAALALPVVTRIAEPGAFGLIATALIVTNLLAVTVDLGLSRAVLRRHFRGEAGPAQARALLTAAVLTTIVTSALVDVSGPWWSRIFADVPYGAELRLAVWGAAAVAARNAVQAVLRARDRTGWYVTVMLLSTAGAQLLGVALMLRTGAGPVAYLAGLAAGAGIAALVGLIVARPRLSPAFDGDLMGWALRFAGPALPAEVAAVAIWFGDRVIIERLVDLEAVGRYQIAYTLGSVMLMLTMAASQAWAPLIHGAAPEDRLAVTDRTRHALMEMAGYGVVAVALLSPLGLLILAPAAYEPLGLVTVVAVVALATLPLVSQQAATHLISDAERTGALASRGVAAVVVNLALNVALVPPLGLTGAALATLLTYLAYAYLLGRVARRTAGASQSSATRVWLLTSLGAAAGAFLPTGGAWLAIRVVAGIAVAVALLRAARRHLTASRTTDAVPTGTPA